MERETKLKKSKGFDLDQISFPVFMNTQYNYYGITNVSNLSHSTTQTVVFYV